MLSGRTAQGHRARRSRSCRSRARTMPDREGDRVDDVDVGEDEVDQTIEWALVRRPSISSAPPCSRRPSIIPRAQRRRWRAKALAFSGRVGEGDAVLLVADPAPLSIIAQVRTMSSPIRSGQPPTSSRALGPVDAEGALRDHRALEEALLALDRGDAEEVVPLLGRVSRFSRELRTKTAPATATVSGARSADGRRSACSASGISSVSASTVAVSGVSTVVEGGGQGVGLAAVREGDGPRSAVVELGAARGQLRRCVSVEPSSATRIRSSPG